MLLALRAMRRVLRMLAGSAHLRTWQVLFILTAFFLAGYVATLLLLLTRSIASLFAVLTGVICLFGALFVFLVVRTGRLTMLDLDRRVSEQAADLTGRKAELERAMTEPGDFHMSPMISILCYRRRGPPEQRATASLFRIIRV